MPKLFMTLAIFMLTVKTANAQAVHDLSNLHVDSEDC